VKPKAEPSSGRPREGEFSSPVTARRTARRASRPFLPKCRQQPPRPPQDHEHDIPHHAPRSHRPRHQPRSIIPPFALPRFPSAISHPGRPLAHNAHSAPGPTLHICVVVGRGRGSPGWSEAERRRPPSSRPGAVPQTIIERAARVPHSDASPGERHTDEHPRAAPRPRAGTARRETVVVAQLAQEASVWRAASADRAGRSIVTSRAGTRSRPSWPLRSGGSLGTRSIRQSPARIRSRVVNTMRSRPR
jgi:hypothetical protein